MRKNKMKESIPVQQVKWGEKIKIILIYKMKA